MSDDLLCRDMNICAPSIHITGLVGGDPLERVSTARSEYFRRALPQTPQEIIAAVSANAAPITAAAELEARRDKLRSGTLSWLEVAETELAHARDRLVGGAQSLGSDLVSGVTNAAEDAGGVLGAIAGGAKQLAQDVGSTAGKVGTGLGLGAGLVVIGAGAFLLLRR